MASFFSGDLFKTLAGGILTLGTSLILNNQAVQNAKGQANSQNDLIKLQIEKAKEEQQNLLLLNQMNQNQNKPPTKSNLPLYIGLGLGGVLVVGIVIFAVTRK